MPVCMHQFAHNRWRNSAGAPTAGSAQPSARARLHHCRCRRCSHPPCLRLLAVKFVAPELQMEFRVFSLVACPGGGSSANLFPGASAGRPSTEAFRQRAAAAGKRPQLVGGRITRIRPVLAPVLGRTVHRPPSAAPQDEQGRVHEPDDEANAEPALVPVLSHTAQRPSLEVPQDEQNCEAQPEAAHPADYPGETQPEVAGPAHSVGEHPAAEACFQTVPGHSLAIGELSRLGASPSAGRTLADTVVEPQALVPKSTTRASSWLRTLARILRSHCGCTRCGSEPRAG
mmetsp:Transcript_29795/g.69258  ORF Transcript_29795/g.69258 Transcript_29795/m.69258 type:complete len:286 (+) Transcript_29795:114-971(+)